MQWWWISATSLETVVAGSWRCCLSGFCAEFFRGEEANKEEEGGRRRRLRHEFRQRERKKRKRTTPAPKQMQITTHSRSPKTDVFLESSLLRNPPLQSAIFAHISLSLDSTPPSSKKAARSSASLQKDSKQSRKKRSDHGSRSENKWEQNREREKRDLISLMAVGNGLVRGLMVNGN